MRVPVIAGNWKMYKTAGEAAAFVRGVPPAGGLPPFLGGGEMLPDGGGGKTFDVVGRQLAGGLKEIAAADGPRIIVAYEPGGAIGTGKTGTPDQAQEGHAFLRGRVDRL